MVYSLLDTDLYKLSMGQFALHQFPSAVAEYKFKYRNTGIDFKNCIDDIKHEILELCSLRFNDDELEYLSKIRFFKNDYIEFLRLLRLNRQFVNIQFSDRGELGITITGPWFLTIYFETPVLAIINECYFKYREDKESDYQHGLDILNKQLVAIENDKGNDKFGFKFADFGTRRRYSLDWQDKVLRLFKDCELKNFIGTSNVYFAKKYNFIPIGTMAHEIICSGQQLGPRLVDSQKFMLQKWAEEYRGDLGIALSDTLGIDFFLKDFDLYFSKLFDGIRQDSGNPEEVIEKVIKHYELMRINPLTKTVVCSDGLIIERAYEIYKKYKNKIGLSFGIGTSLMNCCVDNPLNIVIKLVKINGRPVAKLSDSDSKCMCEDIEFLNYLKSVIR